jgi:hypothetical protein
VGASIVVDISAVEAKNFFMVVLLGWFVVV